MLKLVQPTVSRHLAYLTRAGLVIARREGKWMHYAWASPASPAVRNVLDALRDSMAKDPKPQRERALLQRLCC